MAERNRFSQNSGQKLKKQNLIGSENRYRELSNSFSEKTNSVHAIPVGISAGPRVKVGVNILKNQANIIQYIKRQQYAEDSNVPNSVYANHPNES